MKLKQYLSGKALAEFLVTRVELEMASGGQKIATLWLETPIPVVTGSQFIKDPVSGASERIKAYDIDYVKISEDDFDAEGIEISEDGTGVVRTNELALDVAKNSQEVWLKREKFTQFARGQREARAGERQAGILTKMKERETKSVFKGVTVEPKTLPESVADTGTGAGVDTEAGAGEGKKVDKKPVQAKN